MVSKLLKREDFTVYCSTQLHGSSLADDDTLSFLFKKSHPDTAIYSLHLMSHLLHFAGPPFHGLFMLCLCLSSPELKWSSLQWRHFLPLRGDPLAPFSSFEIGTSRDSLALLLEK